MAPGFQIAFTQSNEARKRWSLTFRSRPESEMQRTRLGLPAASAAVRARLASALSAGGRRDPW